MLTPSEHKMCIIKIGVLALQGGFSEHVSHLQTAASVCFTSEEAGVDIRIIEVRTATDLWNNKDNTLLDGLIIPGGESTSMKILMMAEEQKEMIDALKEFVTVAKKPVFGTCAGLIMLANYVEDEKSLIGGLDINVERNYYGSQVQSFEAFVTVEKEELQGISRMVFIRAPRVIKLMDHQNVIPLARYKDSIVAVQQNNMIATTFHPELTTDFSWHSYFLKMILKENGKI